MANIDRGAELLRNCLIEFLSNDYPFTGEKCLIGDHWRYFFADTLNESQRGQILRRPKLKRSTALSFSQNVRQLQGNPRVTWLVSKWLSTTNLVLTDWETHSVYWNIYRNGSEEAKAIGALGVVNMVHVDWTVVSERQGYAQATAG